MNPLSGFFGQEAGQRRRAWLDEQEARLQNALSYYAGPHLAPRINALSQFAQSVMSGADYRDALQASRDLVQSRQLGEAAGHAGSLAGAAAAVFVPGVSHGAIKEAGEKVIRAYHGSPHDFDRFEPGTAGMSWLTTDRAHAEGFGDRLYEVSIPPDRVLTISPDDITPDHIAALRKVAARRARDEGDAVFRVIDGNMIREDYFLPSDIDDDLARAIIQGELRGGGYDTDNFVAEIAREAGAQVVRLPDYEGMGDVFAVADPSLIEILRKIPAGSE